MDMTQNIDVMMPASTTALSSARKKGVTMESIEKASKDFESVFMAQMLKPMFDGVETDPAFGGGHGEDAMRDLLVQEYGKSMAQADDFGLSKAVMAEMIKIQNKAGGQVIQGGYQ